MSAFHAAVASMLLALGVGMTMIGRSWPERGRHRARTGRPVEEWVPARVLIPALAAPAFAHCTGCRDEVPVTVHPQGARRCGQGHITIHTTTGD